MQDIGFRMNDVIRDVFIDYTKNYMTPDDIIKGTGPVKWSFGSSIFFSWTAITTIGKISFVITNKPIFISKGIRESWHNTVWPSFSQQSNVYADSNNITPTTFTFY